MKQWEALGAVEQNPEKVSGVWVFRGTRVPVAALFENLRDGATVDEFLEWFPGVEQAQVDEILKLLVPEKLGGYAELSSHPQTG